MNTYLISYDIGTTGVKTCLFEVEKDIKLLGCEQKGYSLFVLENGGVEQDADEWWQAMCDTTQELLISTKIKAEEISGLSFCSQMQGIVLVDEQGQALRRPMSYMDQRARKEIKEGIAHGLQIAGANIFKLLRSLIITGAVSSSVKDPVWKYKWVENNEPEIFKKVYKWLDVKEYLICRCTNKFVMTEDTAYSTFLYDTRSGKKGWNASLCKMCGVNMEHLPKIIKSTDKAGSLTEEAASELGLAQGMPVFGGGGDASLIGVGAGCGDIGDTHIYSGTSGWVSTIVEKQIVDVNCMIASIVGAQEERFNYFAEMETAGKCLEWVKDHLALDEIDIYLEKKHITEGQEVIYKSLYEYMMKTIKDVPPGANGVIFTPWLHGNRCPFEDPNSAGMFFNIKVETGKTEMIRAVLEGVCYHLRWMLECQQKKIKTSDPIRFVGGGALSEVTCQILADVTGCTIETVASPQNVGAVGAAAVMGVALGKISSIEKVREFIPTSKTFYSDSTKKIAYDKHFEVFKKLYKTNKQNFKLLNS